MVDDVKSEDDAHEPCVQPPNWWNDVEVFHSLNLNVIVEHCRTESLAEVRARRGCVARRALDDTWLGWDGLVARIATGSSLSFFPSVREGQNAFSRQRHDDQAAAVRPSLSFLNWLTTASQTQPPWQLRGAISFPETDLASLLGGELCEAMATGAIEITQTSLWAGAGGTRTPLHVDRVHAIIFQIEGTKRFFLSSRDDVERAVFDGKLPEAVRDEGGTDAFCVDGTLEEVHGLRRAEPTTTRGALVTIERGDCLILPAGLFHDVECMPGSPASMSLTIRFELNIREKK